MASGGLVFGIAKFPANEAYERLLTELSSRMQVVRRLFTLRAARKVLAEVKDRLPSGDEYDAIRSMLVARDVTGLSLGKMNASAVVTKTGEVRRQTRDLPENRTLVIVGRPRPSVQPPPEEIFIMRTYNPWTVDTVPFIPKRSVARTTYRIVTEEQVERVREERTDNLLKDGVIRQIRALGVDIPSPEEFRARIVTRDAGESDLVKASLGTEFGLAGFPFRPHWRTALATVKDPNAFPKEFIKSRDVLKTLADPDYTQWEMLFRSNRLTIAIGLKRVEMLQEFQDKVRIGST